MCAVACAADKRIAVLDLAHSGPGVEPGAGKIAADILEQKMVEDGRYNMIERTAVQKVLTEQDFANSDRVDPSTAAKIGKILGVDAIIYGAVAQCNVQVEMVNMPSIGKRPQAKGNCSLTAKVVDTTTAAILASVSGNAETERKTFISNFDRVAVLRDAINGAVDEMLHRLDGAPKMAAMRSAPGEISGMVADVDGEMLVLNFGSAAGLQVGQTVEITRSGRQITDPKTNEVIKTVSQKIG
jgi:curli biogenesis system outer membrane secretion channel CsgG